MSGATLARTTSGLLLTVVLALAPAPTLAAELPYRIMMILWGGCDAACNGFQDYLREKEVPAEFVMRETNPDPLEFRKLVAEARSLNVDLVVTWGTTMTLGMVSEYDKVDPAIHLDEIPVLFILVSDPVASRIVPSLQGSARNVSGTLYLVPEAAQMRLVRSYMPFEKVGLIYNADELSAVQSLANMQAVAAAEGFTLVTREVPSDITGRPLAETLPRLVAELAESDVDLVFLVSSTFLVLNRHAFTGAAIELDLPVVSADEEPVVDSNALIGLVSRNYSIGKLTAARAEQILVDGADPGKIPIEGLHSFSLIVNMEVARKLERYPPMSLLDIADVIKTHGPQP